MSSAMMMERTGMGMPGMGDAGDGHAADGHADRDAGRHELDDGAALHVQDREVPGRHEDHLHLRRQDGLQHGAEPVHDAGRRHVQLLRA